MGIRGHFVEILMETLRGLRTVMNHLKKEKGLSIKLTHVIDNSLWWVDGLTMC